MIKEKYIAKHISFEDCKEWLLYKHYAKRIPPIEYSIGLFDENNVLKGVCTIGTPVSNPLRGLWNDKYKVMELNRLVVEDGLEKNTLSFFCIKRFKNDSKTYCISKLCRHI